NRDMKRSTIIAYSVLFILALSLQGCGDNGGSSGNPPDIGGQFNKDPTAEYTAYSYAGVKPKLSSTRISPYPPFPVFCSVCI
ncbi:MAG: hypothetical protein N0E48_09180, partial [Candidatus Thiodiazotropha endolucinida]|nr:hypothetical protein [Candidatus Thiodiazotropha taylori]MCW4343519.1 hypothetical protein [Candidatus Thiodiazotropha endolucinida]